MSLSVREIIKEACTRINLVPRRQAVPGDILENAFNLLKGVVDKYNKDNLLSWTQNSLIIPNVSLIHIYDNTDVLKGEYNLYFKNDTGLNNYIPYLTQEDVDNDTWAILKDHPNAYYTVIPVATESGTIYTWVGHAANEPHPQRYQEMKRYESMTHVQIRDVAKINSIYVITPSNEEYRELTELDYKDHTDYDRYGLNTKVFTYTEKSQGEWLIEIKPLVSRLNNPYRLKLNYNEGFKFELDDDLFIPDNYTELLIVALAHKLSIMYPRLDEAQMNRLEKEVSVLVDNVKTPKASDRMVKRQDYWSSPRRMSQQELMSGDWLY